MSSCHQILCNQTTPSGPSSSSNSNVSNVGGSGPSVSAAAAAAMAAAAAVAVANHQNHHHNHNLNLNLNHRHHHHHHHHHLHQQQQHHHQQQEASTSSSSSSSAASALSLSSNNKMLSTSSSPSSSSTSNSVSYHGSPYSLLNLSAKIVAENIPFQLIEQRYQHIPEPVQRRIIFWSFPRCEEDIKMYSSLSTSSTSSDNLILHNHKNSTNILQHNQQLPQQQQQAQQPLQQPLNQAAQPPPNNNNNRQYPLMIAPQQGLVGQDQAQNNNNNNVNNNSTPVVSPSTNGLTSTSSNNNNNRNNQNNKQLTFHKGLRLYNEGCVHDVLQVGFNLSGLISLKINSNNQLSNNSKIRGNNNNASSNLPQGARVNPAAVMVAALEQANNQNQFDQQQLLPVQQANNNNSTNDISSSSITASSTSSSNSKSFRSSVTFDRCKITSVSCSCESQDIFWCEHVVALILYRIRKPETIDLRIPISETLLSLDRQQLQKLVQYIIAEHHTEVLPTAQRLLDEMRQSFSLINQIQGAPDPTAGASASDENTWHLDEYQVNEKVQNYLNLVSINSKDAVKQINALFGKIREMFTAKDSNGTRLLRLITEQFLLHATKNEKSRPLWDQLVSLWVIVMLNPDINRTDKDHFVKQLQRWARASKCPKEDIERRAITKRKAAELSDDEDGDNYLVNPFCNEYLMSYNQSNNYPAHMATHMHRYPSIPNNSVIPVLRSFNPPICPCHQVTNPMAKKMRTHHMQHCNESYNHMRSSQASSSSHKSSSSSSSSSSSTYNHNHNQLGLWRSNSTNHAESSHNDNRTLEPRSIFLRAVDFQNISWDDPHLQLILKEDGPIVHDSSQKSILFDFRGNPLWIEPISRASARVETLKSHGYKQQALRLAVASVRRLKLLQDQWCLAATSESNNESPCMISARGLMEYNESWIGHPFDPINALLDILLEASMTETNGNINQSNRRPNNHLNLERGICSQNSNRCSCPYNQAWSDFTHKFLPDLASLSYQHRMEGLLHSVNLANRLRPTTSSSSLTNLDKTPYNHVAVPGCCQRDTYLTLGVEVALIALGQQRSIPTLATAHDRAVRQEAEIIAKLESIDTTDPLLIDILKHQSTLLLEGGPYQSSCCGVPTDSAPLHTFARFLFDSLVAHYPQLAYKVGVFALKMPLLTDENGENYGNSRSSPRTINYNHLQSEQLSLAQTMLSKAKEEAQQVGFLKKAYRASVKNIRNPASLLKLAKHAMKEAKPSGTTLYPNLLKTAFDIGLQVLKMTISPHTSNGKTRREAISFIVECATDIGLEAVIQVMKESGEYFSAIEALNLVVARDNDHVNLYNQAEGKLKEDRREKDILDSRSRDLVLDCAKRDPTNCALEALKFCETHGGSLERALQIVIEAGSTYTMACSEVMKVAHHINGIGMKHKAFDIAMVAAEYLFIQSLADSNSYKKDIFSACEYAQNVNGFGRLLPKIIKNIDCAIVLSEIYHQFSPNTLVTPAAYRNSVFPPGYVYNRDLFMNLSQEQHDLYQKKIQEYNQQVEDSRWWTALLERTMKQFDKTARDRLSTISPRHYGEFIDFMAKAQGIYEKAVDGPQQFKDLISQLMKLHKGKKKLMEKLKSRFDYSIKAVA